MMHLDIHTIINLLALGNFTSAAVLVSFKNDQNLQPSFLHFITAKLLQALAWMLLGLRGEIDNLLSVHLGNSLLIAAFSLEGLALATVKEPNRRDSFLFAVLGIFGIGLFLAFAGHSGSMRIVMASLATGLIYGTTALLILRSRSSTALHKTIAVACLLFSCILIFRIWFAIVYEEMTLLNNIPIQVMPSCLSIS